MRDTYLDRLSGKMDLGSVKDKLLLVCGRRLGGVGGAPPLPNNVFTSNELLNPDKNGVKLPPKAATTAAYYEIKNISCCKTKYKR